MSAAFAFALGEIVRIGADNRGGSDAPRGKVIGQIRYIDGGIGYVVSTWSRERGVAHDLVAEFDLSALVGAAR